VWFLGLQLTLHELPEQVLERQGVRHFGATLDRTDLEALYARLTRHAISPLRPLTSRNEGTPHEETKAYFCDPSGNVIELKAYADLDSTVLASGTTYA
jgi:extradiol dioxygenase family protein